MNNAHQDSVRFCSKTANPWVFLYVALSVVVVAIWLTASSTVFSESYLSALYPRYCSFAPPFSNRQVVFSGTGPSDQFLLVRVRDARALNAAPAVPDVVIVFAHGHHGDTGQADTIAYATAAAFAATNKWIELYAVDFNSGSSAFDANVAHTQVDFLCACLRHVDMVHLGVEVVLIGHSMGGVVARAALAQPFFRSKHLKQLITINSPLQMHPLFTDPKFSSLYDIADEGLGIAMVSVLGGHRDTLVPSTFGILKQHANLLTLFTASMQGVWTDLGHDDAMSCTEIWDPVIRSVIASIGVPSPSERIRIFRRRLQPSFLPSSDTASTDVHDSAVERLDQGVYHVVSPAALLSQESCSKLSITPDSSAIELMDIPLPYTSDNHIGRLKDFIPQDQHAQHWSCLISATDPNALPLNVTTASLLTYGNVKHLDATIGALSPSTLTIPPSTATAVVIFRAFESRFPMLWRGLLPAVFVLTISRSPAPSLPMSSSPLHHEVLVVQSDPPASGELRWYRNTDLAAVWRTTIAFHPGNSKSLRSRLLLSPDFSYDLSIDLNFIASLGAGLRLADKSALISPFVSIIFYKIACLPHPTIAAAFFLPLLSWLGSQFLYDDDWSAPKYGIVLNIALFWIGVAVLTLVSYIARLLLILMRCIPRATEGNVFIFKYLKTVSTMTLLLTICLGPWPFVVGMWLLLAAKMALCPASRFKSLLLCAYFTVIGLKATLVFSVWQRLSTSKDFSWTSKFFDAGPGIGGFFGSEVVLAAPIGIHMTLLYHCHGMHDRADAALWLRMAAAFTCFVTLSSHYRLFEFIFATSLFAFCCILEHISSLRKGPVI